MLVQYHMSNLNFAENTDLKSLLKNSTSSFADSLVNR